MPLETESGTLVETARDLAAVTEKAWDYAAARDFVRLAEAIERRGHLIKTLRSMGDLSSLPTRLRAEVAQVLERTQEIDCDIKRVLENEMASDNQAITDAATKAKALSAYERMVPHARRFDKHK